jgi:hypothetical protein
VSDMSGTHSFGFDRVFGPNVRQVEVFSEVAKPVVEGNYCIFSNVLRCPQRFQWHSLLLRPDRKWKDFHHGG